MGRYVLLWLLGTPIPILLLIWFFGGLHWISAFNCLPRGLWA
jgi:hypothetical protein